MDDLRGGPRSHYARIAGTRIRARPDARPQVATLAGVVLLVAACSAAAPAPSGVARLSASSDGATGGPGAATYGHGTGYEQQLAYSQCMRTHGLPDFPDPVPMRGGGYGRTLEVQKGSDLDPATPRFQAAYRACKALAPVPPPGQQRQTDEQRLSRALQYSACMRARGVAGFPDPVLSSNGSVTVTLNGVDTESPTFQSADAACQSALSGSSGAAAASGGSGAGSGQP